MPDRRCPGYDGQAATHSAVLSLTVGVYWLMRSLKDSIFATVVGIEYQPQAKMLSLLVVTVGLVVYGSLVERLNRSQLFSSVFGFYAAVFLLSAAILASPSYGLHADLPPSPGRLIGWALYFAIESYGTLSVSLFWQLTNAQMSLKSAKAHYGLIVAGGQIGAIAGCALVMAAKELGVVALCALGGLGAALVPVIMFVRLRKRAAKTACTKSGVHRDEPRIKLPLRPSPDLAGSSACMRALEGLWLIGAHAYTLGLFALSAIYKVIATIMDYQLQRLAKVTHVGEGRGADATAAFAAFMGSFGLACNVVRIARNLARRHPSQSPSPPFSETSHKAKSDPDSHLHRLSSAPAPRSLSSSRSSAHPL